MENERSSDQPPPRADRRMVSDAPLRAGDPDLLQFGTFADALTGLIDNPATRTPRVLAINAPWADQDLKDFWTTSEELEPLIIEKLVTFSTGL